jgi:ubiquitin C-terminal hydrolase
VLIVQLKRFDPVNPQIKLATRVNYPLTGLDLSPFVANMNNSENTTKEDEEEKEDEGSGCVYDLYGVVHHTGTINNV